MPKKESENVKLIHEFLKVKFESLDLFTKKELANIVGDNGNFDTYWSKKIAPLLVSPTNKKFRVSEYFRRLINYKDFSRHFSQSTKVQGTYNPIRKEYISFQFFLPLANELHLTDTLDSLFYSDRILRRLKVVDKSKLNHYYPPVVGEPNAVYETRLVNEISSIFGGYSVHHVSGRFRGEEILSFNDANTKIKTDGIKYLFDETTAIIRFIIPLEEVAGPSKLLLSVEKIRWVFMEIFVKTILECVSGEAEVWVLEGGVESHLYIYQKTN